MSGRPEGIARAKKLLKNPFATFILIALVAAIFFLIIIKALSPNHSINTSASRMQNQHSQQVGGNLHYTTQETLSTLTGETDNIQKGLAKVESQVTKFKSAQGAKTTKAIATLKKELEQIKAQNHQMQSKMVLSFNKEKQEIKTRSAGKFNQAPGAQNYPIAGSMPEKHGLVWLSDQSTVKTGGSLSLKIANSIGGKGLSRDSGASKSLKIIPAFTIPANSLLTGVTPEQPLVGMIPTDGTVVNPQTVLFMIGANNLAANNWKLPPDLKGIQGNAVCQGVFVWFNDSYANCAITSLTMIFHDGRIATATAQKNEPFGHLTTLHGSPNIPGYYHGNALYAGAGTGFFAGLQGFGNAYASEQQQVTSIGNQAIISYKNAFSSGLGKSVGTSAQYMNQWWQNLLKSTTDFVYVPNWNPKNHKILVLNAVITKAVDINYDQAGRKVMYGKSYDQNNSNSLN